MIPLPFSLVAQAAAPGPEDDVMMEGLVIAAVGLLIVFVALVLISIFIATLPRVLTLVGHLWPEVDDHHGLEHSDGEPDDDLAVLAAIGMVLHTEFQRQLVGDPASKTSS